jgi:hypothetical protein
MARPLKIYMPGGELVSWYKDGKCGRPPNSGTTDGCAINLWDETRERKV